MLAGTSDNDPNERPYWWRTFNGDHPGDYLGYSVSGAGDVNNDGYGDLIVGAYRDDNNGADSGTTRVFSGVDGSILHAFNGDSAGDWSGYAVSSAGDVNGDGYGDLIVGASRDGNNGNFSGSARVFSGVDGSILYTFNGDNENDYFGVSVSDAGDVNGDGYGDLIVGATFDDNNGADSGSARVFSGVDGSILYTFNGDSEGDWFGVSVSDAGDVDGDSRGDLIVGAYLDDNNGYRSGSARVFSGMDGSILYTFNGDDENNYFGFSVDGAGDVNNDGYGDLIVGAYRDDNNGTESGSARVFSGADGAILYTFAGDSAGDFFGRSVSGIGDINNDGYADLMVGADEDDNNGTSSGSVRIFSGVNGSILYNLNGDSEGDGFGRSVSGAGDVNNDGYPDVIVGAYGDDNNDIFSGSARVILSSDLVGDRDLDFVLNGVDAFPDDPSEWLDTDEDDIGNNEDWDDDGDGAPDIVDSAPLDHNNSTELALPIDSTFKGLGYKASHQQ